MMRLAREPDFTLTSLEELTAVALAIESGAVGFYRDLALRMDRIGAWSAAATFRHLVSIELGHVTQVGAWASGLTGALPSARRELVERLWPMVAEDGTGEAASLLLTPYRALAMAVRNEDRAFAFYSYLAATASTPAIRAEAERMAGEELQHARLLRTERRRAYHRQRPPKLRAAPLPTDPAGFRALALTLQRLTVAALERLDAESPGGESAPLAPALALLDRLEAARPAAALPPGWFPPATDGPAAIAAARLLEWCIEIYEAAAAQSGDESVIADALALNAGATAALAGLGRTGD
jgi:rubrerythrin